LFKQIHHALYGAKTPREQQNITLAGRDVRGILQHILRRSSQCLIYHCQRNMMAQVLTRNPLF